MRQLDFTAALLSALATLIAIAASAQEAPFSGVERVVAVADIHGAHAAFVDVFRRSEIVD